jgi:hypothetical protein
MNGKKQNEMLPTNSSFHRFVLIVESKEQTAKRIHWCFDVLMG